ncbi:putative ADP-ribosylation factor GTPase-activating protein AGD5 [Tetrabaena socialis]|uniref:Putative ADP-ribosylation factor GTPase-activating protein AGD5 n=1 Tax=Tetrabaena socialis TaxID=47790 RepID=A0A2J8AE19_9CHLO|nr:putative ADP-ribosylation factor GTPase-activating protein AGD5 [Tetrabaena socialis]|eukprot:PNH10752.1 putative ADP-ribosylation factor GTPase-activating protein AGD5 [Tetrabaena socialis]
MFNSKRNVTEEQSERHKRLLASILKEEGNKSCADCKTRNPTWASVNLGVFVCLTCSGIHRSLGVHISQVRSCNLDTWLPKQVEYCRVMGNVKGNRYWEARLPKDFRRPPSGNPNPDLAAFIRAKYMDRAFAATDVQQPPTIENYLDHPYAREDEPAASAPVPAPTAGSLAALRATPTKQHQSASSPALTMDLLGGFDELAGGSTPPPAAASALLAPPASTDPFGFGSFVSAPSAGSFAPQRTSLEWTDFHAAAPPASSSASQPSALPAAPGLTHQRSYSDGLPASHAAASVPGPQLSRLSNHSNAATLTPEEQRRQQQPQQHAGHADHHNHHNHHNHHHSAHAAAPHGGKPAASSDPFATVVTEDLLAGLTIHHIMESMHAPSASSTTPTAGGGTPAAAAAAADPFSFTSSATLGDHPLPAPGAGHKRHPSHVKRPSAEEVLRLFDAVPSSGAAVLASSTSDDPFGDFLSAEHVGQQNGGFKQGGLAGMNGLGVGSPNLL